MTIEEVLLQMTTNLETLGCFIIGVIAISIAIGGIVSMWRRL